MIIVLYITYNKSFIKYIWQVLYILNKNKCKEDDDDNNDNKDREDEEKKKRR